MRRKLLGLIGLGTAAVLMLSGFDSAMTVEDLQQKSMEAIQSVEQCSGDFSAGADILLAIAQDGESGAQISMPLTGDVTGSFAVIKEPFGACMNVQFSGSGAGMEGAGSMELYAVENEDGTGTSYVHTVVNDEDSGWAAAAISAEDVAKAKEAMEKVLSGDVDSFLDENTSADSDLNAEQLKALIAKYRESFGAATQLSPEAVDVNGAQCYELVVDITGDLLTGVITDAAEIAGEVIDSNTLGLVEMITSSLDIKVASDYDAESFLPVAGSVDLAGSDFSLIAQIAASMMGGEEIGDINLTVNKLGAEYNVSYDAFGGITVPEEALSASVVDAAAALGSVAGAGSFSEDGGDDSGSDWSDEVTVNEDGSYHLEDTSWDGETLAADITAPEGMELSYGSSSYVSFADDSYRNNVSYSLRTYSNMDEALEDVMDTSYMENDESYSDISVTDPVELTLENGITVKYTTVSYKYSDYGMGGTYAIIPVDDMSVCVEIRLEDENYDVISASEEEVALYAGAVSLAS